jgi:hypothetical protein
MLGFDNRNVLITAKVVSIQGEEMRNAMDFMEAMSRVHFHT